MTGHAQPSAKPSTPPPSLEFVEGSLIDRSPRRVEWGDCDPAGIVFHPRLIAYFDSGTHALFERALGMPKIAWRKHYGVMGTPIVDLRTRFLKPVTFDDHIIIETQVVHWGGSSFALAHRLMKGADVCVLAGATRIWTGYDATRPAGIAARPVPTEIIEKFRLSLI